MARITHGTLVPNVVTSVWVDTATEQITVLNRSSTIAPGEIYFTVDGTTPTIKGSNCYPSLGGRVVAAPSITTGTTVQLISNAALEYSVVGESV